ncbi:MAG: UvrD-helicase domain-containing protein [Candidatus Helarchaeota archaeon]
MSLTLSEFLKIIERDVIQYKLDSNQRSIIIQDNGPLWIVAGPGSGKTEVLVIRTLKLIFVDGINPKSIIITTFTEKAAKNLFDRVIDYSSYIFSFYPDLKQEIDIHTLRVGTLHSLCSDIMLEYRYPDYENYRLLDEFEQYLFIYEHSDLVNDSSNKYIQLWERTHYLFEGWNPITQTRGWSNRTYPPNKSRRAKAAIDLFDRIVEDMIDLNSMRNSGGEWGLLVDAYKDYTRKLEEHRRCDFAHLQKKFLRFLDSGLGKLFLQGDGSDLHPGISHVMVDEYQDTNPIQEKIYFRLTRDLHNLCVVGDDDQALYRFRGGTVDCMVTFNQACEREWNILASTVQPIFLSSNYRSHPDIVNYYNEYIRSFEVMELQNARVRRKPQLHPRSKISGDYPAVAYITGNTIRETADNFAGFVRGLMDDGIVEDPSQCVLLMKSVRETIRWARPFAQALREYGIQTYNPRSKRFLEQEEVMAALGAFVSIIDPDLSALQSIRGEGIRGMVENWVTIYQTIAQNYPDLEDYVNHSTQNIRKSPPNTALKVRMEEILFRILSREPFSIWKEQDPERSYRLGKLTNIFESYSAVPYPGSVGSIRGYLRTSSSGSEISFDWRRRFYYSFVGLLVSEGLSDPEDEEIIAPRGRLPIMTVHQAKGLEFPFVFIYKLSLEPEISPSIRLEDDLARYRFTPRFVNFTPQQRAEQDLIRFYYVAYSRAQYAVIHIVPNVHFNHGGYGFIGEDINLFRSVVRGI